MDDDHDGDPSDMMRWGIGLGLLAWLGLGLLMLFVVTGCATRQDPRSLSALAESQGWTRAAPPAKCVCFEQAEGLEQLRALEAGWIVKAVEVESGFGGIDTRDDLERARHRLEQDGGRGGKG
jgi:hypothetical protein